MTSSGIVQEDNPFVFACPDCHTRLLSSRGDELYCPMDGSRFYHLDGIWRFLTPEREAHFRRFVEEYETIRRAEGRGFPVAKYYQALPFDDLSGRFRQDWQIRSKSFTALLERVIQPLESAQEQPLKILDLGAGNGWLSNRLAQRGHCLAAVDLAINDFDGLGAYRHYTSAFIPIQADFSRLPLVDGQADLIVFNASFHYATSYEEALQESLRVLHHRGRVVILDTPIYHLPISGEKMVRERQVLFQQQYGFPSNALPSENYLTGQRLEDLGEKLHLHWRLYSPAYGWRWQIRRFVTELRAKREAARFALIVGERDNEQAQQQD